MASTVETISNDHYELNDSHSEFDVKPSDSTAVHRICGWALKSTIDRLKGLQSEAEEKVKKDEIHVKRLDEITKQLNFSNALKLYSSDKHLLPKAVQYLDRGGLTFFKPIFWSWMNTLKSR